MALTKSISDKGVTSTYWMIDELRYSKIDNKTKVKVKSYVNKDVRDADIMDFLPIRELMYSANFDGFKTVAQAYTELQTESRAGNVTLDEPETIYGKLYGATDVLEEGQTK